jgi:hypothetical protein
MEGGRVYIEDSPPKMVGVDLSAQLSLFEAVLVTSIRALHAGRRSCPKRAQRRHFLS